MLKEFEQIMQKESLKKQKTQRSKSLLHQASNEDEVQYKAPKMDDTVMKKKTKKQL